MIVWASIKCGYAISRLFFNWQTSLNKIGNVRTTLQGGAFRLTVVAKEKWRCVLCVLLSYMSLPNIYIYIYNTKCCKTVLLVAHFFFPQTIFKKNLRFYVYCPTFFSSDCNQILIFSTDFHGCPPTSNFTEIGFVRARAVTCGQTKWRTWRSL